MNPNILIDKPVHVIGKKRGIVDLMLSCATRRHRADDIEHLAHINWHRLKDNALYLFNEMM